MIDTTRTQRTAATTDAMPSPTTAPDLSRADIDGDLGDVLPLTQVWRKGEPLPDFAADQVRDDLDALREAGLIVIRGEKVSLTLAGRARLAIDRLRADSTSSCGSLEDTCQLTDDGRAYVAWMNAR